MKNKIAITLLVIIIAASSYIYYIDNKKGTDQIYLLPVGFEGCVVIYYDIKDARPLEIKDNQIIYDVPEDGLIYTSSPMNYGWVNSKQSGAIQLEAFYVDKEGKKIRKLPDNEILFGANGSMQDERSIQDYYYLIFGPEEIIERGCTQVGT